jgi:DNA-binding transcriptional MerR regulator
VLTISELERASEVPRSTIHYYVRQGLLPAPQKTADTRALYSQDHLALLLQIRQAKDAGRSLSEIRAEIQPRVKELNENSVDLEAQEYDRAHRTILRFATREFVRMGYRRTRVEDLTRELGISSSVFYDHFASKRHLLVECFQTFIEWGVTSTEARVAHSDDLIERQLMRIASSLSIHNLSADVLALVSTEALQGEDELRQPVEEAWDEILRYIVDDIVEIRGEVAGPSVVPDKLLAHSLNEALQGGLTRMLWDKRFSLEDVIRTHVWLWLAIRKALLDPDEITQELNNYLQRIRDIAAEPPPVFADIQERG